jgi:tight adherence protein B
MRAVLTSRGGLAGDLAGAGGVSATGGEPPVRASDGATSAPGPGGASGWARVWHADPVELFRRWRARRRADETVEAALAVLDAIAPALRAGLSPSRAVELAVASAGVSSEPAHLSAALGAAVRSGRAASQLWRGLAERSGSAELQFVAGAWRLSESTGAPLAEAVERAAERLRDARTRRRRVAVAVAGPRATVTVLTLLPVVGPVFALACGLGPAELYLGSPAAAISALVGCALAVAGRLWCRRLVRSALRA